MLVQATINLPGLSAQMVAEVDPDVPYIKDCLLAGYLIPWEGEDEGETVSGDNVGENYD